MYVCILIYIHTVNNNPQFQHPWHRQIASLWPAAKGSLAKVRKPCIRQNCRACASGDLHPAWLLSLTRQGRRTTLYVPQAMVATIRKAIRNGRRIEQLLQRTGPQLLKNYRKSRTNQ